MPLRNRVAAELIGTFWLVLGGCGFAVQVILREILDAALIASLRVG